jgi:hypothetical protein
MGGMHQSKVFEEFNCYAVKVKNVKEKLFPQQAVEAYRVVRCEGSHIV